VRRGVRGGVLEMGCGKEEEYEGKRGKFG